jgi:hypothetical protein
MSKIRLTLSDPIQAQEQTIEILFKFKEATNKEKLQIKSALEKATRQAQALNQTFIAARYRQTLGRMEQ